MRLMEARWVVGAEVVAALSSRQRKRRYSNAGQRKGMYFDKEHTWTMHFWQHLLDCSSLQLAGP